MRCSKSSLFGRRRERHTFPVPEPFPEPRHWTRLHTSITCWIVGLLGVMTWRLCSYAYPHTTPDFCTACLLVAMVLLPIGMYLFCVQWSAVRRAESESEGEDGTTEPPY